MRAIWLVRSRSTSAAAAVHVRVRAMACRSWSDKRHADGALGAEGRIPQWDDLVFLKFEDAHDSPLLGQQFDPRAFPMK